MTVRLSQLEFQQLCRIVQRQAEFGSARDRRRLVTMSLAGIDRAEVMIGRIDFDGTPFGVATEVIRLLADFGQVEPGREALGVFLDQLLANMGISEESTFLAELIDTHKLNMPQPLVPTSRVQEPKLTITSSKEYVFLSYARPDQSIADEVEKFLIKAGLDVFRDIKDIRTGDNWYETIENALKKATRMVLLLSASSMPFRKEVHREWFFFDQNRKPIHPLYIQDCILHSRMLAYNYIDAQSDLSSALQKLITHPEFLADKS